MNPHMLRWPASAPLLLGLLATALATALAMPLAAQEPPAEQDRRQELRERMKTRYPLLARLRDAGKIGETMQGEVALVKDTPGSEPVDPDDEGKGTLADLVAAENTDRRALYELLADELGETPAVVARQNALRNIRNARPAHWIQAKGRWVQKKDVEPEIR